MCRPHPGITRFFINPRALFTFMMTNICTLCLHVHVRHIFIYRNSLDTVRSWLAVMPFEPYLVVIRACLDAVWVSNIFPFYRNVLRLHFTSKPKIGTTICMIAMFWANQMLFARKMVALDHPFHVKTKGMFGHAT